MKLTFFNFREYLLYANKNTEWIDSITPSDAADLLGLTRQRVLQLVDSGELDAAYILHEVSSEKNNATTNHVYLKRNDIFIKSKQLAVNKSKSGNPTKFFHNRVLANPEKLMPEFNESLSGWLLSRTSHLHDFITSTFDSDQCITDTTGTRKITELLELLEKYKEEKHIPEPMLISVSGMFLQATLLSAGLWSNQYEPLSLLTEAAPTDLQRWLIRGFSSWAPSFDVNPPISSYFVKADDQYPYLIGQLGVDDEGFSIPVLISSDRRDIIETVAEISTDKHAFSVKKLRGLLTHKTHLSSEERTILGDNNDFCIKINTNEHILIPDLSSNNDPYSAYLWVCLGDIAAPSTPANSFFIWEHTDLTSKESIAYNLDSLEHKIDYIRAKNQDKNLVLLHKSMPIVPGEPVYPPEKFYDFLLKKSYPDKNTNY